MRRYLYDGNIALDNGLCERFIRHFAVGRLNWLQCYSIEGSKDMGVAYGVMETALANGADPYTYMEYLLTKMPAILEGHDYNWVEDMEPWSDAFHAFEQEKKECRSRLAFSLPGLTPFEELPPVAAHTYLNNMRTGKQSSKVIAERERRRKAKLPVLSPKEEDKS